MLYATVDNLIEKLIKRQQTEDLNDTEFAEKLGISRSLWRQTKFKEREVGQSLLSAVMRVYPELAPEVLAFLREGKEERSRTPANAPQT